ncbi:hypothetical protein [Nocardia macrotermitis]|uniref:Uncharacterized protein n=1 Tax=Nocardia macrotermitis TaxID=2585198 RepID=A0A7K0D1L0_9NOCA|nr:hypothetical protein [Nocardia macrotermitis]MQY19610.1 hypothetical protein [Nocardia macrotermitis]
MVLVRLHRFISWPEPILAMTWWRGNVDPPRTTFEMYALDKTSYRDFWLEHEWTTFSPEKSTARDAARIEVRATADEIASWSRAQTTTQDALRNAEVQLAHDLGLRIVAGDLYGLRHGYGWHAAVRRFGGSAVQQAFDEFRERLRDIDETYRPVRELIATRVQEAGVRAREEAARERAAAKRKAQQDILYRALAARTRWSYEIDEPDHVVHIFRTDDSTTTIPELTRALENLSTTGNYTLTWNEPNRTEFTRDTGIDFETWWRTVTPDSWPNSRALPTPPRPTPSAGSHTSYGVGGHTGIGGHFGI